MKKIIQCFLILLFWLITDGTYAEETDSRTNCERYKELADVEGKAIPDNFVEICETLEAIKELEAIREVETTQKEKEQIATEILADSSSVEKLFFDKNQDSLLDRPIASSGAAIELNASTENSNIFFRVGKTISSGGDKTAQFTAWNLTASSPIDPDNDAVNIATLDGLANSTKLAFNLDKFFLTGTKNPFDGNNEEDAVKARMICSLIDQNGCDINDVQEGLKEKVARGELNLSEAEQRKIVDTFESLFFEPDSINYGFSFKGTVGYENFEFVDAESGETVDQSEIPWSIGAFFSFNPPTKYPLLFTLGLEYQEAFASSSSQIVCPTSNGGNTVVCNTGIFAEPIQSENLLFSFETRSNLGGLAFSLRGTYDFENENTGIDLPIYLISDEEGNLNGGLRLGWTNVDDDNDLILGVFIGSKFNLF